MRATVAFIFLWHGVPKAINWEAAVQKFIGFGLPGFLGPITGIAEVIASVLLVIGVFHRWAAAALGIIIIGALVTVQLPGGFTASLERDLMIMVASFALMALGPGEYALKKD